MDGGPRPRRSTRLLRRAKLPTFMDAFQFFTKLDQTLLLGLTAKNVEELAGGIRTVPDASIYFHTHHFLHQHHYLSPEPPNDFAYWVTEVLGDDILGEQLWSIDTVQFKSIADLRVRFVAILKNVLAESPHRIECAKGEEFHFMAARTFVLPTNYCAHDVREFADHLEKVSVSSIYFHMFDAKLRLKTGENDFSRWLRDLGKTALADAIKRLDPYSYTLDGLRQRIRDLVKRHGAD